MGCESVAVSVVLPTYNRADVLGRSIESVLAQTYDDFELIIVDDASTDETLNTVDQFNDDRMRVIQHETNRGAAAARNTGIEVAQGDIIAFQDSDDVWDEKKLEKQVAAFDDSSDEVGVVYTGAVRKFNDTEKEVPGCGVDPKEGDIQDSILEFNFVTTQAAAVRKQCFSTVGQFAKSLPALIDWELWIRMSEFYEFKYVDEQLVTAYLQEDSISTDNEAKLRAREKILQKHRSRFNDEQLARQLFWVGHGAMKAGATQKGRRYLRQAAETHPKFRNLGALALSLFGSRLYQAAYDQYRGTHASSS